MRKSCFIIDNLTEVGLPAVLSAQLLQAGRQGLGCQTPGLGLEPRFIGPKPTVLPLDDPGIITFYSLLCYFSRQQKLTQQKVGGRGWDGI